MSLLYPPINLSYLSSNNRSGCCFFLIYIPSAFLFIFASILTSFSLFLLCTFQAAAPYSLLRALFVSLRMSWSNHCCGMLSIWRQTVFESIFAFINWGWYEQGESKWVRSGCIFFPRGLFMLAAKTDTYNGVNFQPERRSADIAGSSLKPTHFIGYHVPPISLPLLNPIGCSTPTWPPASYARTAYWEWTCLAELSANPPTAWLAAARTGEMCRLGVSVIGPILTISYGRSSQCSRYTSSLSGQALVWPYIICFLCSLCSFKFFYSTIICFRYNIDLDFGGSTDSFFFLSLWFKEHGFEIGLSFFSIPYNFFVDRFNKGCNNKQTNF